MELKLSIWLFIPAFLLLCLAYGFTMERIERKRMDREHEERMDEIRNEHAELFRKNRQALGDAVVDNIMRNNPECDNMTDACESGVR